jgi:gamma-glutamyltranspeptidase/glutathione hydrolase
MDRRYDRRQMLRLAGGALLAAGLDDPSAPAADEPAERGRVVGQPEAARAGADVLAAGGNAVDAAVTAALVAGVVGVHLCGIGGYGGHLTIGLPDGKVTAIDFNSAAPAAARPDLFPLTDAGAVKGEVNMYGWLAAGVPGTLAGLQLALDRYGTRPFREAVRPAIRHARNGFPVSTGLANAIRGARTQLAQEPAAARLLLDGGEPLKAGTTYRNPDLADLLTALAEQNSVESFYRGAIARQIAAAFRKHGGLVTEDDLAAYRAREVAPLRFEWRGATIATAPLTAGGATVLEALAVLAALGWDKLSADDPRTAHARLEALRLAWHDRLAYFGDPDKAEVPLDRLLSPEHARELAGRVEAAVRAKRPAAAETDGRPANGTVHLSAADSRGMLVALTLTHGGSSGARVAVEGLGLLLGHGMSRFDPRPGRPNSPGPGKRPLHNMCPTVVLREGRPVLALGGAGGRKIPNAICDVLLHHVGRGLPAAEAVAARRLHTEGGLEVTLEAGWPAADVEYLKQAGYTVKTGPSATVHAVAYDPQTHVSRTASR